MDTGFGKYLKDYLEFNNISQTEFATRLNITQKHMNEMLNGKADITLEMAASIEQLTDIPASFIMNSEYRKYSINYLLNNFEDEKKIKEFINEKFHLKELDKRKWIDFNDITNNFQNYIDIMKFLNVKDLEALGKIQEKTLFKKNGNDENKLSLWIARCNQLSNSQKVNEYVKGNLYFLIQDLEKLAYDVEGINIEKIQKLLNGYGIYFVVEKALSGTRVRGCFRVKLKNPAIYITQNYSGKDSFYFELFHELGHCKSDYNEAKNKTIIEGSDEQEKRADEFALNTMIDKEVWKEIEQDYTEKNLLEISNKHKIPMSFIVGRLAMKNMISYKGKVYRSYYQK